MGIDTGSTRVKKHNPQEISSRKNTGLQGGCNAVDTERNYYGNYHAVKQKTVCDYMVKTNWVKSNKLISH